MRINFKTLGLIGVIVLYCFLVSLPILNAGFYSDDAWNIFTKETMLLKGQTLWQYIEAVNHSALASGRLFPASVVYQVLFFSFFQSSFCYEAARVIFIWLSFFSVAWLVKLLSNNKKLAMLFLVLLPIFLTVRIFHDALTTFGILLPMVVILISLSLGFYCKYNNEKNKYYLCISLLCYCFGLLSYELGTLVLPIIIVLSWLRKTSWKQWILVILPYVALMLVYLAANFLLRQHSKGVYSGIQFGNINSPAALTAFFSQFTAAIPLTYLSIVLRPIFPHWLLHLFIVQWYYWLLAILALFATSYFLLSLFLQAFTLNQLQLRSFLVIGIVFVFVPPCLMAINAKYQVLLSMGYGYLPVYIQYIGMDFLLLCLFSKIKNPGKPVLIFFLSLIICINFMNNLRVILIQNNNMNTPRMLIINASARGLFADLPENAIIVSQGAWLGKAFFSQFAGINRDSVELYDRKIFRTTRLDSSNAINQLWQQDKYLLDFDIVEYTHSGYIVLGKLLTVQRSVKPNEAGRVIGYFVENPVFFLQQDSLANRENILQLLQKRLPEMLAINALPNKLQGLDLSKGVFIKILPGVYHISYEKP